VRETLNKQISDAETSIQDAFNSASNYLSQKWENVKPEL